MLQAEGGSGGRVLFMLCGLPSCSRLETPVAPAAATVPWRGAVTSMRVPFWSSKTKPLDSDYCVPDLHHTHGPSVPAAHDSKAAVDLPVEAVSVSVPKAKQRHNVEKVALVDPL